VGFDYRCGAVERFTHTWRLGRQVHPFKTFGTAYHYDTSSGGRPDTPSNTVGHSVVALRPPPDATGRTLPLTTCGSGYRPTTQMVPTSTLFATPFDILEQNTFDVTTGMDDGTGVCSEPSSYLCHCFSTHIPVHPYSGALGGIPVTWAGQRSRRTGNSASYVTLPPRTPSQFSSAGASRYHKPTPGR